MTMDDLVRFGDWWDKANPRSSGPRDLAKMTWDAATAAERERIAQWIEDLVRLHGEVSYRPADIHGLIVDEIRGSK